MREPSKVDDFTLRWIVCQDIIFKLTYNHKQLEIYEIFNLLVYDTTHTAYTRRRNLEIYIKFSVQRLWMIKVDLTNKKLPSKRVWNFFATISKFKMPKIILLLDDWHSAMLNIQWRKSFVFFAMNSWCTLRTIDHMIL